MYCIYKSRKQSISNTLKWIRAYVQPSTAAAETVKTKVELSGAIGTSCLIKNAFMMEIAYAYTNILQ